MKNRVLLKLIAFYLAYIGIILGAVGVWYFIVWKMLKFVIDYVVSVM